MIDRKMELILGIGVRLKIVCPDLQTREEAIHRFTGGTTLLTGKYELGIDQRFGPDVDGKSDFGAILHLWVPIPEIALPTNGTNKIHDVDIIDRILNLNGEGEFQKYGIKNSLFGSKKIILVSGLRKRLRDSLLPIPCIKIYTAAKKKSLSMKISLEDFSSELSLTQITKIKKETQEKNEKIDYNEYCIRLLGGEVKIEDQFIEIGLCGAAFFFSTNNFQFGLTAGRDALKIIEHTANVSHILDVCASGVIPNTFKKDITTSAIHTFEIIMNSFSLKDLLNCIESINNLSKKYENEVIITPVWYSGQWGNIFLELKNG